MPDPREFGLRDLGSEPLTPAERFEAALHNFIRAGNVLTERWDQRTEGARTWSADEHYGAVGDQRIADGVGAGHPLLPLSFDEWLLEFEGFYLDRECGEYLFGTHACVLKRNHDGLHRCEENCDLGALQWGRCPPSARCAADDYRAHAGADVAADCIVSGWEGDGEQNVPMCFSCLNLNGMGEGLHIDAVPPLPPGASGGGYPFSDYPPPCRDCGQRCVKQGEDWVCNNRTCFASANERIRKGVE